jgi:ACS family hexuronate transporter-like MFS transporter
MFYQIPAKQKRLTQEEFELIKDGASDDEATEQKTLEVKVKWSKLFSFPQTWALIAGKGLIDPIFWFFLFWLPSYFSTTYALDLTRPSLELIIIYSATTLGSFLGGYFSSLLVRKGWGAIDARKRTLLIFAITAGFAVISAQFTTAAWMAVAVISIAVAVHQAWATNVFTMAADMFPKETVGSAVGIAGMAGAVGGIFFPLLVGFLLDTFKASGNITAGYNMLFTICGFTYLTAWLIIHFLTKNRSALKLEDFK